MTEPSEPTFTGESLLEIIAFMQARLAAGASPLAFRVLDPDLGRGRYPGESIEHAGRAWVHRPFRIWVDLAERLGLRLLTPHSERELERRRFEPLDR
ncbi:MAG: hypothetical protein AB7L28_24135, partial [Kofleriaceae bacterium]